ncbi:hypothetical protein STXM2123_5473 [Streptomyces sp. F-3]|nr:hypothetical protein STXM2123_5473 [Streptomyces sp. F-3]
MALTAPNRTAVAPMKSEPVMTTGVPPVTGPCVGLTELTKGGMLCS